MLTVASRSPPLVIAKKAHPQLGDRLVSGAQTRQLERECDRHVVGGVDGVRDGVGLGELGEVHPVDELQRRLDEHVIDAHLARGGDGGGRRARHEVVPQHGVARLLEEDEDGACEIGDHLDVGGVQVAGEDDGDAHRVVLAGKLIQALDELGRLLGARSGLVGILRVASEVRRDEDEPTARDVAQQRV